MSARYRAVYKDGKLFAEYENGVLTYLAPEYSAPKRSTDVKSPMIMRDMGEYVSPLDGSVVSSRSTHREHMRTHDVVEVGNERIGNMTVQAEKAANSNFDREVGEAIKRRIDEVAALPQRAYDEHVVTQKAEHEAVADLITATA